MSAPENVLNQAAAAVPSNAGDASLLQPRRGRLGEVFRSALRLGLTSFGGPVAHIGYFHAEYVARRRWLDEAAFADLVVIAQFLPGPASSKLGLSIGLLRAGVGGAILAWLGFTIPSAILLVGLAQGAQAIGSAGLGLVHGLQLVAVPIVALAVQTMARNLVTDRTRATIAVASAVVATTLPSAWSQVGIIAVSALLGWMFLRHAVLPPSGRTFRVLSRRTAVISGIALLALLVVFAGAIPFEPNGPLAVFGTFFRAGALVFGGGHVVLPLLEQGVVATGWVSSDQFLAGYGLAQAVPGPLFTFAAYLGALLGWGPLGIIGATLALVAIFLPAFLLTFAVLPFWDDIRRRPSAHACLAGVNAGVVGLLGAALYDPIVTSSIHGPRDFAAVLIGYCLLVAWRTPPWALVIGFAAAGYLLGT